MATQATFVMTALAAVCGKCHNVQLSTVGDDIIADGCSLS